MGGQPLRLLDQVRAHIRIKHYSIRTEVADVNWNRRYTRFHDKRTIGLAESHPCETGFTNTP